MIINKISTTAYSDQQAGTSGLRKKTKQLLDNKYYLENYIQSCFDVCDFSSADKAKPLIIGGDGRFFNKIAIATTLKMAVANGFKNILVCKDGLLSTPAASHFIRKENAAMAFIFTASHNPAGIDGDFGIKINLAEGQPAPLSLTEAIYTRSKIITEFAIADFEDIDLSTENDITIGDSNIKIVSSINDYADYMQTLFDFKLLKEYLSSHSMIYDGMHAVTGPYAIEIFSNRLGVDITNIINSEPKEDFSGLHPDPNPNTNPTLYKLAKSSDAEYSILVASDGDGDRNMILGKGIYVNPCDSLAIIAHHIDCIPHLSGKLSGVARSMPTSRAIDVVCENKGISCYETPTGWKFFGDLLNQNKVQLCGEESFGTSSNHIREKDGIWAALCWLSILAKTNLSVIEIVQNHWQTYGRHYYQRHDFDNLDSKIANKMLAELREKDASNLNYHGYTPTNFGEFSYYDCVDNLLVENQGYQVVFADKARFIARLSGTGTSGATLRVYIEHLDSDSSLDTDDAIDDLLAIAIDFIGLEQYFQKTVADNIV